MPGYPFESGVYYLATLEEHCVNMTNKGGVQWVGRLSADHRKIMNAEGAWEWEPIPERPTINAYLPLAYNKHDTGAPECGFAVESLMSALGWEPDPSRPVASLEAHPAGKRVQFTVKEDYYNNEVRTRVSNIYPEDYEGGELRRESESTISQLDQQWGSVFRARFGGKTPTKRTAQASPPLASEPQIPGETPRRSYPYEQLLRERHGIKPGDIKPWTQGLPILKKKFSDASPPGAKDLAEQWGNMLNDMVGSGCNDDSLSSTDMGALALLIDNGHFPLPF